MKKILSTVCVALILATHLVSCSEDEIPVSLSSDCYISSFSLGYIRRTVHTLSSKGEDSTYTITYNGVYYPFTIDQRKQLIFNADSLPLESRTGAILANIGGSGVITYRTAGSAQEWLTYTSNDSIDFSHPLELAVQSTDGTARRIYKLTVNVHKQDGAKFNWNQKDDAPQLTGMTHRKALALNGSINVWGETVAGIQCAQFRPQDGTWSVTSLTGADDANVHTLQSFKSQYYLSNTAGDVFRSTDGITWERIAQQSVKQLVASGKNYLYALTSTGISRSADGITWAEETLDDKHELLPTESTASTAYTQPNGNERILLLGHCSHLTAPTDTSAVVWSKSWISTLEEPNVWNYFPASPDNKLRFPKLTTPVVFRYSNFVLACGGASVDGKHVGLKDFYISLDNGITWQTDKDFELPKALHGTHESFALATDSQNYIWIFCGTKVWRGRLNQLGFK